MEPIVSEKMTFAKATPKLLTIPIVPINEVWMQCCIYMNYLDSRYWVSNYGRVYTSYSNRIMIPKAEKSGYLRINLFDVNGVEVRRSIHRLVMESFCWFDGCENYQVNHIDGDKSNNFIGNLEWATSQENNIHALYTGLRRSGEDASLAKYDNATVIKIADLLMQDLRYEEISMIVFGEYNEIYRHLISNIANKHCWNILLQNYEFPSYKSHKQLLSDQKLDEIYRYKLENPNETAVDICRLFVNGFDDLDIKKKNCYLTAVRNLLKNRAFDHIYSKYI